jgi:hypothetical protein
VSAPVSALWGDAAAAVAAGGLGGGGDAAVELLQLPQALEDQAVIAESLTTGGYRDDVLCSHGRYVARVALGEVQGPVGVAYVVCGWAVTVIRIRCGGKGGSW